MHGPVSEVTGQQHLSPREMAAPRKMSEAPRKNTLVAEAPAGLAEMNNAEHYGPRKPSGPYELGGGGYGGAYGYK